MWFTFSFLCCLECELHEGRVFCLFYLLLYPQHRFSAWHIMGAQWTFAMNEWMKEWSLVVIEKDLTPYSVLSKFTTNYRSRKENGPEYFSVPIRTSNETAQLRYYSKSNSFPVFNNVLSAFAVGFHSLSLMGEGILCSFPRFIRQQEAASPFSIRPLLFSSSASISELLQFRWEPDLWAVWAIFGHWWRVRLPWIEGQFIPFLRTSHVLCVEFFIWGTSVLHTAQHEPKTRASGRSSVHP